MRDEEFSERQWDSLGELLRYRRAELGLTQRDIEEKTSGGGPKTVNRGAYGRIEGGYWIPKNRVVLDSLALALELDADLVTAVAERTRNAPQLLSREYSRVNELIQAVVSGMDKAERDVTLRPMDLKIGLFKEPLNQLARNFIDFWKGNLKIDDIPSNGLRPLRYYLRPFCSEDIEQWKKTPDDTEH